MLAMKGRLRMSRGIKCVPGMNRRAFTLIEVLTTIFILAYIFLSAWSVYVIGWKWWHEMAPVAEAQRIARSAIAVVIDGARDSTAGQETIGFTTYNFRNGISATTVTNNDIIANPNFSSPVISLAGRRIDFKLEGDAAATNPRAFYLGQDATTGIKAVYYQDNAGAVHVINATRGIDDLVFALVPGLTNVVEVTASVQRTVPGTKYETTPISVQYTDYVYLRNT